MTLPCWLRFSEKRLVGKAQEALCDSDNPAQLHRWGDGGEPFGQLTMDTNGNLYGKTQVAQFPLAQKDALSATKVVCGSSKSDCVDGSSGPHPNFCHPDHPRLGGNRVAEHASPSAGVQHRTQPISFTCRHAAQVNSSSNRQLRKSCKRCAPLALEFIGNELFS